MALPASIDEYLLFDGYCHIKKLTDFDKLSVLKANYLSICQVTEGSESSTGAIGNGKGRNEIQDDVGLIELAGLAIELCVAILAFDMGEQRWT